MPTTETKPIRLTAADLKKEMESGRQATILDVRADKIWQSADHQITGSIRVSPDGVEIDPGWPKERLAVAY